MASAIGDLVVRIGTDSRKFDSGLASMTRKVATFGGGILRSAAKGLAAFGAAAVGAGTAVVYLAKREAEAIDAISVDWPSCLSADHVRRRRRRSGPGREVRACEGCCRRES